MKMVQELNTFLSRFYNSPDDKLEFRWLGDYGEEEIYRTVRSFKRKGWRITRRKKVLLIEGTPDVFRQV